SRNGHGGANGKRDRRGSKKRQSVPAVKRAFSAIPQSAVRLGDALPSLPKRGKMGATSVAERLPKLIERAGAAVGVAAAGLELIRELRSSSSNGTGHQGQDTDARASMTSAGSRSGAASNKTSARRAATRPSRRPSSATGSGTRSASTSRAGGASGSKSRSASSTSGSAKRASASAKRTTGSAKRSSASATSRNRAKPSPSGSSERESVARKPGSLTNANTGSRDRSKSGSKSSSTK